MNLKSFGQLFTKVTVVLLCLCSVNDAAADSIDRSALYIRDPYILADKASGNYYLYSSSYNLKGMPGQNMGVVVYSSKDLQTWVGPKAVFETGAKFWAEPGRGSGGTRWASCLFWANAAGPWRLRASRSRGGVLWS